MIGRPVFVRVLAAAALASGLWLCLAAMAEEKKAGPAAKGGKVVGILTDRKDTYIMVKPEGKQEPEKYLLAPPGGSISPAVDAAVKKLFMPNLVTLKWQRQGDDSVVTEIALLIPKPKKSVETSGGKTLIKYSLAGSLVGTVIGSEVSAGWWGVDVKPIEKQDFIACGGLAEMFAAATKRGTFDLRGFEVFKQDYTERYAPPFVMDPAKKEEAAKLNGTVNALKPGDKVKVDWYYDERKRGAKFQLLSSAPAAKTADKEKAPEKE